MCLAIASYFYVFHNFHFKFTFLTDTYSNVRLIQCRVCARCLVIIFPLNLPRFTIAMLSRTLPRFLSQRMLSCAENAVLLSTAKGVMLPTRHTSPGHFTHTLQGCLCRRALSTPTPHITHRWVIFESSCAGFIGDLNANSL